METVFWCVTVPGIYIAGMLLTYWVCRKLDEKYDEQYDSEELRDIAMLWPITLIPLLLVVIINLLWWLMDMIGGKHD